MAAITIDPNYGYVLLAATSTFFINAFHIANTGKYRTAAKVPYPLTYAPESRTDDDAHRFNCAQRSHANFIENQVSALGSLLIAGIRYPIAAALMGAAWSVCRYIYMVGYSQGGVQGKGRYKGIAFWLFQAGLMGLAGWVGAEIALGK